MAGYFTLGKEERLKSHKLIERLFKEGKSFNLFPYRVSYLFLEDVQYLLQAGFSASARNLKKAVDRNRIKRLTKEAYRLQKPVLQEALDKNNKRLIIFLIYTGKEVPEYQTVQDKMQLILQRLISIANEKAITTS